MSKLVVPVGNGFWNIRGSYNVLLGLIDIGTHMSLIQLSSGKFLVIDTIALSPSMKLEIDAMTDNGNNIEAVIGTHPFHTLYFNDFYKHYPQPQYYGTPRHIRNLKDIPWAGSLNDCEVRNKWSPDVEMRIPAGAEFVAPEPERTNHFISVFVYHPASRTLHVDDTIMVAVEPGLLLRLAGFKHGDLSFHPSIKGPGLHPTEEAPFQFRDWMLKVLSDWDIDNICAAHTGNKIGGSAAALKKLVVDAEPLFNRLSKKHAGQHSTGRENEGSHDIVAQGNECG